MSKRIFFFHVMCCIGWTALAAQGQTYFRYHGGTAVTDSFPLPERFDDKSQLVWRRDLAPGHSTPCLLGGLVCITTYQQATGELSTVALEQATGAVRWRRTLTPPTIEPYHTTGSPAASSVACDGQRVYSFFGSYGLLCYDLAGTLLWSQVMGPFQDEFGAASSPILVDGKVILNEDHDIKSFLIAIDSLTGETAWRVDRPEFTRSYATPVLWNQGGLNEIVVAGPLQLVAYDASNGARRW